jgi:uracil-DNA glycosylase
MPKPKTLFQLHVDTWKDCKRCPLHDDRRYVVLARGSVPCHVLFVGEGPGHSENTTGQPFVGPAGHLLNEIIERGLKPVSESIAVPHLGSPIRYAITNLIACIPLDHDDSTPFGQKLTEPPDESVRACAPRLVEFIDMCRPRLIITVGSQARDWLDPNWRQHIRLPRLLGTDLEIPRAHIRHPANILRSNFAHQEILTHQCVVALANAAGEMLESMIDPSRPCGTEPVNHDTVKKSDRSKTKTRPVPPQPHTHDDHGDYGDYEDDIPF